jgi:Domain of unknown function (DUF5666)
MVTIRAKFITFVTATLLLGACGGGGGSESAGGIGGTGSSLGPVSGFGSIFVNGTEFATDNATILIEGETQSGKGDLSKIKIGQIVLVRGVYASATAGTANEVIYFDNLDGPITAKNLVNNSFTAMGQTVLIDGDTVIGTKFVNASGLDDLNINDIVEVSGSPDGRGNIVASFVEKKGTFTNGATEVELKGNVSALDINTTTFNVGPLTIDYDATGATVFKNLTLGDLMQPLYIEVKGTTFDASGALIAASIERIDRPINPGAQRALEITGVTADCAAPCSSFTIEGQRVITTAQTTFSHGNGTDLVDNRKIEVGGTIDALGILVADSVVFVKGSAQIEALADGPADVAAQTFNILGITVKVSSITLFEDAIELGDITAGSALKILGYRIGDALIIATQIGRANGGTRLQGPLQTVNKGSSSFTILSVPITGNAETIFRDVNDNAISFAAFFDATPTGTIVGVKGIESPDNRIDATGSQSGEVEIQD